MISAFAPFLSKMTSSGVFIYGYRSNQIVTKVVFRQISHKKKKSVDDVSTDFSVAGAVRFELTTRGVGDGFSSFLSFHNFSNNGCFT